MQKSLLRIASEPNRNRTNCSKSAMTSKSKMASKSIIHLKINDSSRNQSKNSRILLKINRDDVV
jgi:hypothetical protein